MQFETLLFFFQERAVARRTELFGAWTLVVPCPEPCSGYWRPHDSLPATHWRHSRYVRVLGLLIQFSCRRLVAPRFNNFFLPTLTLSFSLLLYFFLFSVFSFFFCLFFWLVHVTGHFNNLLPSQEVRLHLKKWRWLLWPTERTLIFLLTFFRFFLVVFAWTGLSCLRFVQPLRLWGTPRHRCPSLRWDIDGMIILESLKRWNRERSLLFLVSSRVNEGVGLNRRSFSSVLGLFCRPTQPPNNFSANTMLRETALRRHFVSYSNPTFCGGN